MHDGTRLLKTQEIVDDHPGKNDWNDGVDAKHTTQLLTFYSMNQVFIEYGSVINKHIYRDFLKVDNLF